MEQKNYEKPLNGSRQPKENIEDIIHIAEEKITENAENILSLIKKHPLESMLIGFGVGCIVGAILSRKI